ncbi:hypothetical protein PITC_022690 [Penicillium italicum]|uniref:Uncharacterized protein n=1 Tax=Penicillium italicum TaxID=40296 RepID=A0A0A2KJ42_PENIT|nr:hypothetical protein PITC_022690 [Penicillium italicum]
MGLGYAFPPANLTSFREKLNTSPQNVESPTLEGSLAAGFNPLGAPVLEQLANGSFTVAPDTWGILKALTDMAKQNTAASATHAAPASTNPLATLELSAAANPYAAAAMSSPFASFGGLGQNAGIMQPPERESGAESSGFRPETTGSHAPVGARCPSGDRWKCAVPTTPTAAIYVAAGLPARAVQAQLPGFGAMLGRAWVTTLHRIAMIAIVREIATTLALFPVGIAVVPVLQLVVARLDRLNAFREGLKGGSNGACLSVPAFDLQFAVGGHLHRRRRWVSALDIEEDEEWEDVYMPSAWQGNVFPNAKSGGGKDSASGTSNTGHALCQAPGVSSGIYVYADECRDEPLPWYLSSIEDRPPLGPVCH